MTGALGYIKDTLKSCWPGPPISGFMGQSSGIGLPKSPTHGRVTRSTRKFEAQADMEGLQVEAGRPWLHGPMTSDDDQILAKGPIVHGLKEDVRASGSKKGKTELKSRPLNGSPFQVGIPSNQTRPRRQAGAEDKLRDEQESGRRGPGGSGVGHNTFSPVPSDQFHRQTGKQASKNLLRQDRHTSTSSVDSYSNKYEDARPEGSKSARHVLSHKPMTLPRNGEKAVAASKVGKGPSSRLAAASGGEDDTAISVDSSLSGNESSESHYEPQPPSRKPTRNLGRGGAIRPMGRTPGELKGRELAEEAGSSSNKTRNAKKPPLRKFLPSSNLPPKYTVKVEAGFLSADPYTSLRAKALNWDTSTGECALVVDGQIFRLNPMAMDKTSLACPESSCPSIWFSFSRQEEDKLARCLEGHYGVSLLQDTFNLNLYLEHGHNSGRLVQSLVQEVKARTSMKIQDLALIAARNSLDGFHEVVRRDADSLPASDRRRKAQAPETRNSKMPRKSIQETDKEAYEPEKPKKKPSRKGKEKEIDEDQPKLVLPKSRGGRNNRKDDRDIVDIASPESAKPARKLATEPSRKSNRVSKKKKLYSEASDDDLVPEPAPLSNPLPPRPENWNGVLFPYPLQGRADINITEGDKWRVEAGDFLNDTLIEFGLKHVLTGIQEMTADGKIDIERDVHLFNSFFYEKLSSGTKPPEGTNDQPWPAYQSIRKWTKSKKVFEKKYLIVPINENAHWYLAVIYNPAGILRECTTPDDPVDEPPAAESPPATLPPPITTVHDDSDPAEGPSKKRKFKPRASASTKTPEADAPEINTQRPPSDTDFEIDPDLRAHSKQDDGDVYDRDGNVARSSGHRRQKQPVIEIPSSDDSPNIHPGDVSVDPMDRNIPRPSQRPRFDRDKHKHLRPTAGSSGVDLESSHQPPSSPVADPDSPPKLIDNDTTRAFNAQNRPLVATVEVEDEEEEPTGSIQATPELSRPNPKKVVVVKKEGLNIYNGDDTWIMTFDSLGGAHRTVDRVLKMWLEYEAIDKVPARPTIFTPSKYKEARVPQQPNFSDCGLYLIHYVEQLLKRTEVVMRNIELYIPPNQGRDRSLWLMSVNDAWNDSDTLHLRKTWTATIDSLTDQYASIKKAMVPPAPEADLRKGVKSEEGGDDELEFEPVIASQPSVAPLIQAPPANAQAERVDGDTAMDGDQTGQEAEVDDSAMEGIIEGDGMANIPEAEDVEMVEPEEEVHEMGPKVDKGKGREVSLPSEQELNTSSTTTETEKAAESLVALSNSPGRDMKLDKQASRHEANAVSAIVSIGPFEAAVRSATQRPHPPSSHYLPRMKADAATQAESDHPPTLYDTSLADRNRSPDARAVDKAVWLPDHPLASRRVSPVPLPSVGQTPPLKDDPIDDEYFDPIFQESAGLLRNTPAGIVPEAPSIEGLLAQRRSQEAGRQPGPWPVVSLPAARSGSEDLSSGTAEGSVKEEEEDEEEEQVEVKEEAEEVEVKEELVEPTGMARIGPIPTPAAGSSTTARSDHYKLAAPISWPAERPKPSSLSSPPEPGAGQLRAANARSPALKVFIDNEAHTLPRAFPPAITSPFFSSADSSQSGVRDATPPPRQRTGDTPIRPLSPDDSPDDQPALPSVPMIKGDRKRNSDGMQPESGPPSTPLGLSSSDIPHTETRKKRILSPSPEVELKSELEVDVKPATTSSPLTLPDQNDRDASPYPRNSSHIAGSSKLEPDILRGGNASLRGDEDHNFGYNAPPSPSRNNARIVRNQYSRFQKNSKSMNGGASRQRQRTAPDAEDETDGTSRHRSSSVSKPRPATPPKSTKPKSDKPKRTPTSQSGLLVVIPTQGHNKRRKKSPERAPSSSSLEPHKTPDTKTQNAKGGTDAEPQGGPSRKRAADGEGRQGTGEVMGADGETEAAEVSKKQRKGRKSAASEGKGRQVDLQSDNASYEGNATGGSASVHHHGTISKYFQDGKSDGTASSSTPGRSSRANPTRSKKDASTEKAPARSASMKGGPNGNSKGAAIDIGSDSE